MAAAATTSSQSTSFSRLARLGAGLGLRANAHPGTSQQRQHSDASDSEWYIPYNGPYEQPQDAGTASGRRGDRWEDRDGTGDGWDELIAGGDPDPFGRGYGELGHGGAGASTSGHGHTQESSFYDEERGRTRSRAFSASSKYSESIATVGSAAERQSRALVSPAVSSVSPRLRGSVRGPVSAFPGHAANGVGIGESPVPVQRAYQQSHPSGYASGSGHGHEPEERAPPVSAPAQRDSLASFWTFGRTTSRKSSSLSGHPAGGRPSVETQQSGPSTGTRQATQATTTMRDRSATIAERPQTGGEALNVRPARPRANTTAPPVVSVSPPALIAPSSHQQRPEASSSGAERLSPSYERHPYAAAFPPTGHREHSRILQPSPKRTSILNINVPFLSSSKSLASLRGTSNRLKGSASTPDLRGSPIKNANRKTPSSPSTKSGAGTKWLSAETWCDALLFPRPRFRLRTAHVISPPMSPVQNTPPHSAPPQGRSPKKGLLATVGSRDGQKDLLVPPSAPAILFPAQKSLPPAPVQPEAGPSDKPLRPPRPKSFALDDLALPSPVPSLATVLKENAAFDKERNEWKKKASQSFQNKRSRSLSQSRVKAKAKLAAKLADSESELVTSFDLIAVTAFHGHQTLKPSISLANTFAGTHSDSPGLNTTSSHSRNTSSTSHNGAPRGHARKESWGKTALKTAKSTANATGLCAFTEDLSPAEEKIPALDGALEWDRTKLANSNPHGERRDTREGDVMLITPYAMPTVPQSQLNVPQPATTFSPSPVPSTQSGSTSRSGVGIALSTPTGLVQAQENMFLFTDHPYASISQLHSNSDDIPRASDYAGPHPTKVVDYSLSDPSMHDVSARHRMPVAAARMHTQPQFVHPYAVVESHSRPTLHVPTGSTSSPASMFAQVGSGVVREVMAEEIQYSPYSARHPGSFDHDNDQLGVEEALSMAFSHGGIGDIQDDERDDDGERTITDIERSEVQTVIVPPRSTTIHYRGVPMPQIDEVSGHSSWQTSQDGDANGNISAQLMTFASAGVSKANSISSPGLMSLDSSPMTSPRQFKRFDDTEDYSDLFYRPGQQPYGGADRPSSSGEQTRGSSSQRAGGSAGGERPVLSPLSRSDSSGSALTNLQRHLGQRYNSRSDDEQQYVLSGDEELNRHHNNDLEEGDEDVDDVHAMVSQGSSPPGAAVPLRMLTSRPMNFDPPHLIPEDVESSRASSILGRFEHEDGTVYYRLGEVPALATPDPVTTPDGHRASAHGSYFGDDRRNGESSRPSQSQYDHERARDHADRSARPSLIPPTSATDTTRASYMTSTSSASRISQLSDFPVPPNQNVPAPGAMTQSYYGGTPEAANRADPMGESAALAERRSRRTTFGAVEEIPAFDSYSFSTSPDR
ncbi:hypothetical protein M0805_007810 [Coniferiporia weirii]|nr:hypothetical protein M0805_007810 [Coniferiporia weirii]